jgi:hypothetical protein
VHGVILEVVENGALTETVVLIGVLNNGLLEVSVEFKNLAVMLKPFRGDLGHSIVHLRWALGHASQSSSGSFAHGLEHSVVDVLLQIGGFLLNNAVLDTEELGLVVTGDGGIGIHISGKERKILGKIGGRHALSLI